MFKRILLALIITAGFFALDGSRIFAADTVIHKHSVVWESYDKQPQSGADSIKFSVFERSLAEVYMSKNSFSIHKNSFGTGKFSDKTGFSEIRLGSSNKKRLMEHPNIIKYGDSYLLINVLGEKYGMSKSESSTEFEANILQFGIGSTKGYGYRLGENSDIVLYHSSGINWSRVEFIDPVTSPDYIRSASDKYALDIYGKNVRFGQFHDGGIRIQPFSFMSIKAGIQESIIFPRHMFWYWLGSEVVEGIAQGLVDGLIDHVYDASPVAGPIVYFALKNGISYLAHELRKKNMNWPVNTIPPFAIDSWKIGIGFHL